MPSTQQTLARASTSRPRTRTHTYEASIRWTGNRGDGTAAYDRYGRDYDIDSPGRPTLRGSSDTTFGGDAARYTPEDHLVAALSGCHLLAYLALCARRGVVVVAYADQASGEMVETVGGSGQFTDVTLRPDVTIAAGSDAALADALHHEAHAQCYIAASVNFPVRCEPTLRVVDADEDEDLSAAPENR